MAVHREQLLAPSSMGSVSSLDHRLSVCFDLLGVLAEALWVLSILFS